MPNIILTERFVEDASHIHSPKVHAHLKRVLHTIQEFPQSGSRMIPDSIISEFGDNLRKYTIDPFDLFYEYDPVTDTVQIDALIPFRQIL